ncbi:hypothetical protein KPMX200_71317 [Klebsiella pneumoniae]|nr:hypothetical protein KPMX200_71317 [Klebsiella pneumoniae]
MVNPPMRWGDQSLTVICKCSAGHVDWDMLTGRHPAPYNATKLFGSGVAVSASPAMFKR